MTIPFSLFSPRKAALCAATITLAIAAAAMLFATPSSAGEVDKVGFVYFSPVSAHGWTYRHDVARQALERSFGIETVFVESVAEDASAEGVIRTLAATGSDIIFATSFGYLNQTLKVAKQFPNVRFEHVGGDKRATNVSTYLARFYEGRAVLGTIAGHMSESGQVGYIAPFPVPEVVRGINAFTLAMRKVNPDAIVKVIWIHSWYDLAREGDATEALIDGGVDVIVQHTDSSVPAQIAEQRGVYTFGQSSDRSVFAPTMQLTAIVNNWNTYYIERVEAVMDGSWTSTDTWNGIAAGMIALAPYGDAVPAKVRAAADAVKDAIGDGSLHPFTGPFNNKYGEPALGYGETLDDDALLSMDWFVEGVHGKLPK